MKISDMILTTLLKKGFLWEGVNVNTEVEVPMPDQKNITVKIKADRMSIKIDKTE